MFTLTLLTWFQFHTRLIPFLIRTETSRKIAMWYVCSYANRSMLFLYAILNLHLYLLWWFLSENSLKCESCVYPFLVPLGVHVYVTSPILITTSMLLIYLIILPRPMRTDSQFIIGCCCTIHLNEILIGY